MHVEAEQVLDPVVAVGARAARSHLHEPRPDGGGGRVDRDRARRDDVRLLQQLVARQRSRRLVRRRAPGEHRLAQQPAVEDEASRRGRRGERCSPNDHLVAPPRLGRSQPRAAASPPHRDSPVRTRSSRPRRGSAPRPRAQPRATCAANSAAASGRVRRPPVQRLQRAPVDRHRDPRPQPPRPLRLRAPDRVPRRQRGPQPATGTARRRARRAIDAHPVEEIGVAREVDGAASRRRRNRATAARAPAACARRACSACVARTRTLPQSSSVALHHLDDGTDVSAPQQTRRAGRNGHARGVDRGERRHVEMVVVDVRDEHEVERRQRTTSTRVRPREMADAPAQHRIRQHANAVELDQHGGVPEPGQPAAGRVAGVSQLRSWTHGTVSSWFWTLVCYAVVAGGAVLGGFVGYYWFVEIPRASWALAPTQESGSTRRTVARAGSSPSRSTRPRAKAHARELPAVRLDDERRRASSRARRSEVRA